MTSEIEYWTSIWLKTYGYVPKSTFKLCSVKSTCVHFFDFKNWLLKIESELGI